MSSFPVGDGEAGGNTPREMVGAPNALAATVGALGVSD